MVQSGSIFSKVTMYALSSTNLALQIVSLGAIPSIMPTCSRVVCPVASVIGCSVTTLEVIGSGLSIHHLPHCPSVEATRSTPWYSDSENWFWIVPSTLPDAIYSVVPESLMSNMWMFVASSESSEFQNHQESQDFSASISASAEE